MTQHLLYTPRPLVTERDLSTSKPGLTVQHFVGPYATTAQVAQMGDERLRGIITQWIFNDPKRELLQLILTELDYTMIGTVSHGDTGAVMTAAAYTIISGLVQDARRLAREATPPPTELRDQFRQLVGDADPEFIATATAPEIADVVTAVVNSSPNSPTRLELLESAHEIDNANPARDTSQQISLAAHRIVTEAVQTARILATQLAA